MTNAPEKVHFDRIMRVELEIVDLKFDKKGLWEGAKGALDKAQLTTLKMAVKRALADKDKLAEIRRREDEADELIRTLGPLGEAAARAAND